IYGLIVTNNGQRNLRGMQISGSTVLGGLPDLPAILETKAVDVVLISESRLDGLATIVDQATSYGISVRLLPSTADVLRGYVRISTPKHPSGVIERVLVVGGAGYLGSTLIPQLLAKNLKVRVLDSLLFGSQSLNKFADDPNFELVNGDVRDISVVV